MSTMKSKFSISMILAAGLLLSFTAVSLAGCRDGEQRPSLQTEEPEPSEPPPSESPMPEAREVVEAMLGITKPDDAVIENYFHGWQEPTEGIRIQYFHLKVTISSAELENFEQQIVGFFQEPRCDYSKGIVSDDVEITKPVIHRYSSGPDVDFDRVDRIYWRYGTGVPLSQESKPFVTRYIYAFVMAEENEERVVYFSYGA